MFVNNIYQAIDLIGERKFVDDKIEIELNDDASFFLKELERFDRSTCPQIRFDRLYRADHRNHGLLAEGVRGLCITKTEFNSIGEEINPNLLSILKKTTVVYLTTLASGWRLSELSEYDETEVKSIKESLKEECEIKKISRFKSKDDISARHCILWRIAHNWSLNQKILIQGCVPDDLIYGKWEDLKQFSNILRMEALGCIPLPLSIIICRHIVDDLATHQTSKKYKLLTENCSDLISEEIPFCISKIKDIEDDKPNDKLDYIDYVDFPLDPAYFPLGLITRK